MKLLAIIGGISLLIYFVALPILLVWLFGREGYRDGVIIVWGGLSVLFWVFLILWIFAMWRGVNKLIGNVRTVVNEDVRPLIATGRETTANVTGTTRFVGDT